MLTVLFRDGLRVITDTAFQPLLEWSVVRVDYAIDIHTPNVGAYVALAKRAKLPRDYIDRIDREGSFYPECDSVTLNFYDKLDQMKKNITGASSTKLFAVMLPIFIGWKYSAESQNGLTL